MPDNRGNMFTGNSFPSSSLGWDDGHKLKLFPIRQPAHGRVAVVGRTKHLLGQGTMTAEFDTPRGDTPSGDDATALLRLIQERVDDSMAMDTLDEELAKTEGGVDVFFEEDAPKYTELRKSSKALYESVVKGVVEKLTNPDAAKTLTEAENAGVNQWMDQVKEAWALYQKHKSTEGSVLKTEAVPLAISAAAILTAILVS